MDPKKPKDDIYHLTAEVEQLLMQKDFDSAQLAIRQFVEQREEGLKKQLRAARKNSELYQRQAQRAFRAAQDFVPYADDDYDR